MNVGIDIENIERFRFKKSDYFLRTIFSKAEINNSFLDKSPKTKLCEIFCIKEAFIKTLKNQKILLRNMEVNFLEGRINILKNRKKVSAKVNIRNKKGCIIASVIK